MTIEVNKNGQEVVFVLAGRLDTTTAPALDTAIQENIQDIQMLIFDFQNIEYISSAGLRVLLSTQKKMNQQGAMKIKNVKEEVMDVFEMTGFADILTIE